MHSDFIIVGQGLCGTLLSWRLKKAGKQVMVIDDNLSWSSSRVAGGIINPVTGKRLVKSWMIDELLPVAAQTYRNLEAEFGIKFFHPTTIMDFHPNSDIAELFREKSAANNPFLSVGTQEQCSLWSTIFSFNYGLGIISPAYIVDLRTLLTAYRKALINDGALIDSSFSHDALELLPEGIRYEDITANQIVFCDGAASSTNPFFKRLPWSEDKGEVLIAEIPDLPTQRIYRYGFSILPWNEKLFWVGASHDWNYTQAGPTRVFRERTIEKLSMVLKVPFRIVDHMAAMRPVNFDRKPFIGFHPLHKQVGIFNGFGGKGCSLAPYFSQQFAESLVSGHTLQPDVSIDRYKRVLSKLS